jgi:molecular chaperone DnaK (HSP70)
MKCGNCKVWDLHEEDFYCSWCGYGLVTFTVELSHSQLYVGEITPIDLKIENTSTRDIRIQKVEVEPTSPDLQIEIGQPPNEVGCGKTIVISVNVDTILLDEGYYEATIRVLTNAGSKEVKLEVVPQPDVVPVTGEYKIYLDLLQTEQNFAHITIKEGVITVEELKADVPWAKVKTREGIKLPFVLDARSTNTLPLEFEFDEAALIEQTKQSIWDHQGNLIIRYRELPTLRYESFRVVCYKPPELHVWEQENPRKEVIVGRHEFFTLTLQNTDPSDPEGDERRGELEVREIEIKNEDGSPCTWLKPTEPILFPIRIPGGEFVQLSFAIQTTEGPATLRDRIGIGTHVVEVLITTNTTRDSKRRYFFEIEAKPMETYRGILAVDFGTSNTCCAILQLGGLGAEQLIPIDQTLDPNVSQKATTAPSAIQYIDLLETGSKEYQIGSGPAALAHLLDARESIITSAKRDLGSSKKYRVMFYRSAGRRSEEYLPREVVADYLRRVKEIAEDHLGARINRYIIAHPSRFSLRQIRDLEQAAKEAFGSDCRIEKIHEPIGAALDFIITQEACSHDRYTLMVYDFGGGTTDITLLEIENRRAEGYIEVAPKVLGATGNPRLGGTEVTEIVMKLGMKRCEEILRGRFPDATSRLIPIAPENFNDPRRRRVALENRGKLFSWAEAAKIAISTGASHGMSRVPDFISLRVLVDDKETDQNFRHDEIVPSVEELNSELEDFLQDAVLMMKKLAESHRIDAPDIILLAGKSSALPVVRQLMKRFFPNSEIRQPSDLKECVVHGACIKELYRQAGASPLLNLDELASLSATTSRIGYIRPEHGGKYFKEIIGAGVPIPEGGLRKQFEIKPPLRRNSVITIVENIGGRDEYYISGTTNPDIIPIETFEIANLSSDVSDLQLSKAMLELEVTKDLDLSLRAYIEGRDEPIVLGVVRGEDRIGSY